MKSQVAGRGVCALARRRAVMESLSPRMLLSVTLTANELHITGTDQDDRISVAATPFINALVVDDNNVRTYYSVGAIKTIIVNAGAGDDRVTVDPALNSLGYDCALYGGDGNDTLTGAGGKVYVSGEGGNDRLRVYAAKTGELVGGNGRDCLYGSDVSDTIVGGGSNDKAYGAGGNDWINTGLGNDTVDAGSGKDTVSDSGGRDSLHGGQGDDSVKSAGAATVYGDEGNDYLVGTNVSGGAGSDSIYGTASGDLLHGDGDDDLIKGGGGRDACYGDDGNDALFGGAADDELHGGGGDDNLYGSDGDTDKDDSDDGHDKGFGEGGADWFESPHIWREVDWREGIDRAGQNKLSQDPSVGKYASGQGVRVLDSTGASFTLISGSNTSAGTVRLIGVGATDATKSGSTINLNNGNLAVGVSATIISKSLGQAGWLSSGAWDTTQEKFVPVALTADQRKPIRHVIVQVPKDWTLGEMTIGGNDIVYYRVSSDASPSALAIAGNLGLYTGTTINAGTIQLSPSVTSVTVPTPDGGTASIPSDTPGLLDGVEGQYRFLAVKRGTVLISNASSEVALKQYDWTSQLLALPSSGDVRIAGEAGVHQLATTFSHAPADVPAGSRGILVNDGAVWLPGDGSSATFTAG